MTSTLRPFGLRWSAAQWRSCIIFALTCTLVMQAGWAMLSQVTSSILFNLKTENFYRSVRSLTFVEDSIQQGLRHGNGTVDVVQFLQPKTTRTRNVSRFHNLSHCSGTPAAVCKPAARNFGCFVGGVTGVTDDHAPVPWKAIRRNAGNAAKAPQTRPANP